MTLQADCAGSSWKVLGLHRPHRSGQCDVPMGTSSYQHHHREPPGIPWLGKGGPRVLRSQFRWSGGEKEARAAGRVAPRSAVVTSGQGCQAPGNHRSGTQPCSPVALLGNLHRLFVLSGASIPGVARLDGKAEHLVSMVAGPQASTDLAGLPPGSTTEGKQPLPTSCQIYSLSLALSLMFPKTQSSFLSPGGKQDFFLHGEARQTPLLTNSPDLPSQWALSPPGRGAGVRPRDPSTQTRDTQRPRIQWWPSTPEQPCRVCSAPQNVWPGICEPGCKAAARPASLCPSGSPHPTPRTAWPPDWGQGPGPAGEGVGARTATHSSCPSGAGMAGPRSANPSSGVHALSQPFQMGSLPAKLETLISEARVLALDLQAESGQEEGRDSSDPKLPHRQCV